MPGYTPERVTSNSADLPEVSLAMVGMSDGADHIKHLGGGNGVEHSPTPIMHKRPWRTGAMNVYSIVYRMNTI